LDLVDHIKIKHKQCRNAEHIPCFDISSIKLHGAVIIESIDSICRDSADTQYMLIQKKILKIFKKS